jgi:GNAT superfamily N-acetyltransferase
MKKNADDIIIREALPEDVPAILILIKELAVYEKLSDKVIATEETLSETIFSSNSHVIVYLAEYKKELAGYAIFFRNFSTFIGRAGIYLEDIYVRPRFRGKGIGKKLLSKVIELARENNYGRVEWCVLDWNKPAIDFYKKLGAEPMENWTIFRLSEDKFKNLV